MAEAPLIRTRSLFAAAITALLLVATVTSLPDRASSTRPHAAQATLPNHPQVPVFFTPNAGQTDRRAAFIARGAGYTAFLTRSGVVLALRGAERSHRLGVRLVDARPTSIRGTDRQAGKVSVFRGGNRKRWVSGLPTFASVRYGEAWPGIDVTYHGSGRALEYDFLVRPGADPSRIRLAVDGADSVRTAADGSLRLAIGNRELRQLAPRAWQVVAGERRPVDVSYRVSDGRVHIAAGAFDRTRPLVIDPVLSYATYLGGSSDDEIHGVSVGSDGSIYLTGSTSSADFPQKSAFDTLAGADAFITKLSPDGTALVYSTYLGSAGTDVGNDIAVGSDGSAFVTGASFHSSFPTTGNALHSCHGLSGTGFAIADTWVARLAPAGTSLTWATCLGADNVNASGGPGEGIAVDGSGNAYVAGYVSNNLHTVVGSADTSANGNYDAFVTKIQTTSGNPQLVYSSYIGGTTTDLGYDIAIDNGSPPAAYVTGETASSDFTSAGATPLQSTNGGGYDAFVTKINGAGTAFTYSTYLGGTGSESGHGIAVDSAGVAYVAGDAGTGTFPGLGTLGSIDGFVAKIPANGTATGYAVARQGGSAGDQSTGVALVGSNVYVTGSSFSDNLATSNSVRPKTGSADAFVRKLNSSLTTVYSTFLGAALNNSIGEPKIAATADGTAYVVGTTFADSFATPGAFDTTRAADEGFLAILAPSTAVISSGPDGATQDNTPTFEYGSDSGSTFECRVDGASFAVCPGTTTGSTTLSAQSPGAHTFAVRQVDAGTTPGPAATRAFTVDTAPPGAATLDTPAPAGRTGFKPTFTWAAATDALTGIDHYEVTVDGAKVLDVGGSCTPCSGDQPSELAEGVHRWKVTAVDGAGNRQDSEEREFTVAVDPVPAFSIAPNPVLVGRAAAFDASGSADERGSIARYEWDLDGDGAFETDGGALATASKTYNAPGNVDVGLRVTDASGNSATTKQTLRISSTATPGAQLGVSINKGAQYTNSPNVTLKLVFPSFTTSILIANDGGFDPAQTFLPLAEVKWKLDSSGPERLPKTVYVRYLPSLTNGLTFTDDIILDERPPVVDSATIARSPAASATAVAAKAKTWKVKVKAHDTNSGVGFVQVTSNKRKPGKLLKYKKSLKAKSAQRPKFLRARDRAGNFSKWRKLR